MKKAITTAMLVLMFLPLSVGAQSRSLTAEQARQLEKLACQDVKDLTIKEGRLPYSYYAEVAYKLPNGLEGAYRYYAIAVMTAFSEKYPKYTISASTIRPRKNLVTIHLYVKPG